MFANRKNQLARYLQSLKDEKEGMLEVNGSVQFMTNFRDLLLFWQDHYLHKDKDCSALEKVSSQEMLLSHNNPCFPCNIAIMNFLVSNKCKIRFHDVIYRTVRMFT